MRLIGPAVRHILFSAFGFGGKGCIYSTESAPSPNRVLTGRLQLWFNATNPRLEPSVYCPSCGAVFVNDQNHCRACGQPIAGNELAGAQPQAAGGRLPNAGARPRTYEEILQEG